MFGQKNMDVRLGRKVFQKNPLMGENTFGIIFYQVFIQRKIYGMESVLGRACYKKEAC